LDFARVLQNRFTWLLFFLLVISPGRASGNPVEPRVRAVDSFSAGTKSGNRGVPAGWTLEGNPGPHSKILVSPEEGGYLVLVSSSDSFGLKKEMAFDLGESPLFSWRWRITRHPEGGDIRQKSKDDQAGQIYVIFGRFPLFLNYRALGYIWDPAAPVGFSGTSRTYSRMKYQVIRSGTGDLGQWIKESRDVKTDFRKLFQEDAPPVAGIMLFINTNFTASSAECHYRNLSFFNNSKNSNNAGKKLE
jgi:hypothetical protein